MKHNMLCNLRLGGGNELIMIKNAQKPNVIGFAPAANGIACHG